MSFETLLRLSASIGLTVDCRNIKRTPAGVKVGNYLFFQKRGIHILLDTRSGLPVASYNGFSYYVDQRSSKNDRWKSLSGEPLREKLLLERNALKQSRLGSSLGKKRYLGLG